MVTYEKLFGKRRLRCVDSVEYIDLCCSFFLLRLDGSFSSDRPSPHPAEFSWTDRWVSLEARSGHCIVGVITWPSSVDFFVVNVEMLWAAGGRFLLRFGSVEHVYEFQEKFQKWGVVHTRCTHP